MQLLLSQFNKLSTYSCQYEVDLKVYIVVAGCKLKLGVILLVPDYQFHQKKIVYRGKSHPLELIYVAMLK
jgi:hypothetical protein